MKRVYLVSYDIADPKRLQRFRRRVRDYGDFLQRSVYRCSLTDEACARMLTRLKAVMDAREDSLLIVDLGPATGDPLSRLSFIGAAPPPLRDEPDLCV